MKHDVNTFVRNVESSLDDLDGFITSIGVEITTMDEVILRYSILHMLPLFLRNAFSHTSLGYIQSCTVTKCYWKAGF